MSRQCSNIYPLRTQENLWCSDVFKKYTVSVPLLFLVGGGQLSVPNSEKGGGSEKNKYLEDFKESLPRIFCLGDLVCE